MSVCRTCSQPIIWARTERGKRMPLDANPICDTIAQIGGNLFVLRETDQEMPLAISAWGLEGTEPHFRSHFDSCTAQRRSAA